jgi:hypothetical protein
VSYFRYVRHADVPRYLASGWIFETVLDRPHGDYSTLMRACICRAERLEAGE